MVAGGWSPSYSVGTLTSTTWFTTPGNYVEFTGVQLEKGSTNTPFEFRPYAIELQLCQRYFNKTYDINTVPGIGGNNINGAILTTTNSAGLAAFT